MFHSIFLCSIISDLGSKVDIDRSIIKNGLSNTEFDEHTRISWKYGCSSKLSVLNYPKLQYYKSFKPSIGIFTIIV